ncbi:lysylphosphatidylglycerol synthase-like protein [Kribbella orskensis]|uniref:Lysylphosphatidylglycerol synthase-like protein n=1 Tax=Kribbella orskensis TaxID=2512216 RepID=A0ABY2B8F4_9ACTN|nr:MULTISPECIES: lysylphosphatidylglycerol synthase domain-containing protein [Kribbella]TCN31163.1 lysylphosphatidylglycerol synthase-like protein [Kribbella sp. VKM Ac-2500]TCO11669.1 lysylphosphatidylglycerol synthase-like protein [Kribbella orskensis]
MQLGHGHIAQIWRIAHAIVTHRVTRITALLAAVGLSLWNVDRVPHTAVLPAIAGLVPFAIGKYVLCPLRWHALSTSGQSRRWHLRAYAESEILGLISPWHAGADLWRIHRLERIGLRRTPAVSEVALDRFVGAVGLIVAVAVCGVTMPPAVLAVALGAAAVVLLVALIVHRRRPGLAGRWPWPSPKVFTVGVLLSIGYQLTILGLLIGAIHAVGDSVSALQLVAVFGASQLAGVLPGVHGASPREGALVAGLASIGVSWTAAFGAVALTALLYWIPALLLGGSCMFLRWRGWFSEPRPGTS